MTLIIGIGQRSIARNGIDPPPSFALRLLQAECLEVFGVSWVQRLVGLEVDIWIFCRIKLGLGRLWPMAYPTPHILRTLSFTLSTIRLLARTHAHTQTHTHLGNLNISIHVNISASTSKCRHMYVYIYIYICVCVCMYVGK